MSIRAIVANSANIKKMSFGPEKIVWSKPRSLFLKLNVDAAYNEDERACASGAIIRDNMGGFVAASVLYIPHMSSASMAEAIVMKHGLELANFIGCNAIEAESDSLEVVQNCSGEEQIWNDATAVYAECFTLAASIGKVEFKHCKRDCNKAAHEIARNDFLSKLSCNWVDEPPSFILQTLIDDVTII